MLAVLQRFLKFTLITLLECACLFSNRSTEMWLVFVSLSVAHSLDEPTLGRGGQQLEKCRKILSEFLQVLIRLSSLQTSFISLDEAIKVTNRRVNALDNVVIPGIIANIHYIESELDELEREDIFRLKKVLQVKNRKEEEEKLGAGGRNGSRLGRRRRDVRGV